MNYRGPVVLTVCLSATAAIALARCVAPEWYHVAVGFAAVATATVLAVLLATADPKVASQAMANARAAQENLRGFLEYRGLSSGIRPVTATSESLRDAISSPVALIVLFALAVLFSFVNSETLALSCADLTPKGWGSLFGEFVAWAFFGQGIGLACWNLVERRKK